MALITADHLYVKIGVHTILRDLDFSVEPGTWTGLIGPNGSGKTTLLRAISGLQAYTGSLALHGRAVSSWKKRAMAQQMAFVHQSIPLSFDFTVNEIVLLGRSPHKGYLDSTTEEDSKLAAWALERVDMEGFAHRSILSLSGGEKQRVFLAQALAQKTGLLLLDEPTTHLDVHHQYAFLELVHTLVREGRTVITVFHDIELAARYAHRILVLESGRLVANGKPQHILTEKLLASVFRIQARLGTTSDGHISVSYKEPTP